MMADEAPPFAELPLFVWLSPAFPVGGFAYSHGLEAAVEADLVRDAATLVDWIEGLLGFGSARQDAILLAATHRAVTQRNTADLAEANALALALSPGRERRLETSAMGNAFVTALASSWPGAVPDCLPSPDIAYPIAVGAAAAAQNITLRPTLQAYGLAFTANLVSAAVRLGPIGQTDGQRVIAAALPSVAALAGFAARSVLDDLGGCAFRSDLASLQHETQYSRLFRS